MRVRAQLVQVTAEKLELSAKLGAVVTESNKMLKKLAFIHGARDRIESLVQSTVSQSVKALYSFVNQVGIQLVDTV